MLSSLAIYDPRNGALSDTELGCNKSLAYTTLMPTPDAFDASFGNDARKWVLSVCSGMKVIFDAGQPFQIGDHVIGLVEVDMVDFRQARRIRNECQRNQTMNRRALGLTVGTKKNRHITASAFVNRKHAGFDWRNGASFVAAHSGDAAHTSEIADFVRRGKLCDRQRSPFFLHAAYLSGTSRYAQGGNPCR